MIRSAGRVRRYHTIEHVARSQNIADHSWQVAQIILCIDPDCRKELLVAALDHDTGECYTGDVPAPFKWDNPGLKAELKNLETEHMHKMGIEGHPLDGHEKNVLRWADIMECMMFSWEEVALGNRSMHDCLVNSKKWLDEHLPPSKRAKELLDAWSVSPFVV